MAQLGQVLESQGRAEEAAFEYRSAVGLAPGSAAAGEAAADLARLEEVQTP
jgi:hypothetical protein